MRNTDVILRKILLLLTFTLVFTACENVVIVGDDEDETPAVEGKTYKVKVITRAAGPEIIYPVTLTVRDSKGNTKAIKTVQSAAEAISFQLPAGDYSISAVSGATDFVDSHSSTPLLVGNANFTVTSSSTNVNVTFAYAVASVNIILRGIPADITSVTAALSPLAESVNGDGTTDGTTVVTLACTKQADGSWGTGTQYVLPVKNANTVLTITLNTATESNSYAVTYTSPLVAAIPYEFKGDFAGSTSTSFDITSTLTGGTWGSLVSDTFSFGPKGTNSFGPVQAAQKISVTSLPAARSIWDKHIVACMDGNMGLLLSRKEEKNVTSAYNATTPNAAKEYVDKYSEESLTDWAIPTKEQVKQLKNIFYGVDNTMSFADFNDMIKSGGTGFYVLTQKESSKNVLYLCDDACSTFGFDRSVGVSAAGKTVTSYRLRLVKVVQFVVE